jgi:hypothetical protein
VNEHLIIALRKPKLHLLAQSLILNLSGSHSWGVGTTLSNEGSLLLEHLIPRLKYLVPTILTSSFS